MACSTDRLSLMAGTYGRVYQCLSTVGTDKGLLNSPGVVCSPEVATTGSSESEPCGVVRARTYMALDVA